MLLIIILYYNVILKRQNRLTVGTDKPKLKVNRPVQSVSDDEFDDVRKRLLEQPRFDHICKHDFCYQ